jgi:pilus assembly protein CpaB
MKSKAILIFGLAIVVGIGAVLLIQDWMDKRSTQVAQKATSTTQVVIAKTPLKFGSVIRAENLDVIDWPTRIVPKGSFRDIEALVSDKDPRVVLRPVVANEPILMSKISGFGGRASLSAVISKKMRGSTIRVNDVNGVAGFVLPGDRVDVLLTRDGDGGHKRGPNSNLMTDVLLQNVKVLATDQNLNENKEKPSVAKAVTLEVTALQAQKLVLGQRVGTLSLALRNGNNSLAAVTPTVRVADLRVGEMNDKREEVVAKPATAGTATDGKAKAAPRKKIVKRRKSSLSKITVMRGIKESEYRVVKERISITTPPKTPALKASGLKVSQPKASKPMVVVPGISPAKLLPKMKPSTPINSPVMKKPVPAQSAGITDLPVSLTEKRRTVPATVAP